MMHFFAIILQSLFHNFADQLQAFLPHSIFQHTSEIIVQTNIYMFDVLLIHIRKDQQSPYWDIPVEVYL